MTQISDQLALPGDPDLDSDVTNLTITSVIATDDRELLIGVTGGRGRVNRRDGQTGIGGEIRAHLPSMPADMFAAFAARLNRWGADAVPIRMCGAPGRPTTLIDPEGALVMIPRRDHPDWI